MLKQTNVTASNAPIRRPNGTYLPGVSGNPSGMSRALVEITELARQHAPEAIAALVEIATSRAHPAAARVAAAVALLDRGYGKPQQVVGGPGDQPPSGVILVPAACSSIEEWFAGCRARGSVR
jgi:hypothetical protein